MVCSSFVIEKVKRVNMASMNLSLIRLAKTAREDMKQLERNINDALEPTLKDLGLMEDAYNLFLSFLQCSKMVMNTNNRKKFLFIAVYLFCPSVLIGHTMPRGFRDRVKDVINVKSATAVSNDVANLLFLYNHYKDFREDVDSAYAFVADGLNLR